jgi:hypothetical protein
MFFQSCEAVGKEALAPERDNLTARVQACGDFVVGHTFGSVQNHLGLLNLKIRQRIFCSTPSQLGFFGGRQGYDKWAWSRHSGASHPQDAMPRAQFQDSIYVSVFMKYSTKPGLAWRVASL